MIDKLLSKAPKSGSLRESNVELLTCCPQRGFVFERLSANASELTLVNKCRRSTYNWVSKHDFETRVLSGRMTGEVFGRGVVVGESLAHSAGSMFALGVELIIS